MKKTNRFSNKSINNRIKFALFIITSLAIAIASSAPGPVVVWVVG